MITPREIEEKGFRMSFRGYNTDDVDDFLQEICDSYAEIYESNRKLKEKTGRLSDAVGQYKSMEDTLSDALNVAGKSADEIEEDANGRAAQIVRNAELTAQSIIDGAEQKIAAEQYRYENIKREIEIYKTKIIELLNAQLCVLKGYPKSASLDVYDGADGSEAVAKPQTPAEDNIDEAVDRSRDKTDKSAEIKQTDSSVNNDEDSANGQNAAEYNNDSNFDDTAEFESANAAADDESADSYAKAAASENEQEYKGCDTENLPCVSMDENGGYTVHGKE